MAVFFKPVKNSSKMGNGKYYALPQATGTMDLEQLAEHMSEHNSPYSKGVIMGLITDMVSCIREMVLSGQNVKLDNLAIFSLGIKNKKGGSDTAEGVACNNCEGVKLRARAIGEFTSAQLAYAVELKKLPTGTSGSTSGGTGADTGGGNTDPSDTGGSGSQTSGSDTGTGSDDGSGFQG